MAAVAAAVRGGQLAGGRGTCLEKRRPFGAFHRHGRRRSGPRLGRRLGPLEAAGDRASDGQFRPDAATLGGVDIPDWSPAADGY